MFKNQQKNFAAKQTVFKNYIKSISIVVPLPRLVTARRKRETFKVVISPRCCGLRLCVWKILDSLSVRILGNPQFCSNFCQEDLYPLLLQLSSPQTDETFNKTLSAFNVADTISSINDCYLKKKGITKKTFLSNGKKNMYVFLKLLFVGKIQYQRTFN